MFGLSAGHILVLGIVALLFGGKRLPELGSSLGKGIRAFKTALDEPTTDFATKFLEEDSTKSDKA